MEYNIKNLLTPCLSEDIESIIKDNKDYQNFENRTVLITGAGDLLGFYFACSLLLYNDLNEGNVKVIVTDKDEDLFKKYGKINSRKDIDFVVSNHYSNIHNKKIDYIIHTEAIGGKDSFSAIENLLNYGKEAECQGFALCTDMSVYGEVYNGKSKISETDEGYVDFKSEKGISLQNLRTDEMFAKSFCSENNIDIKIIRLATVFGANGVDFQSADESKKSEKIDESIIAERFSEFCKSDVAEIKSYCYVTEVVKAIVKILFAGKNQEKYNVSTDWNTSFKYIAEICEQIYPDVSVNIAGSRNISNDYSISPLSCNRLILDNSKLMELGFAPKVTLAEGIKRTVKIIRENI